MYSSGQGVCTISVTVVVVVVVVLVVALITQQHLRQSLIADYAKNKIA